ncbi:M1 family metallopeptidase [Robertkochia solimangrovi]|uniref:M1 family metallopeptidase n=1 Tax=Robertkochia solimangrovi TaxID=2213046 RepID=UPI001180117D|nr:M1 family metallopeptidase [Robertkochia solimangrovi]TRZ43708.1 M1 family peptidase [Robertkochia solimangrovi]
MKRILLTLLICVTAVVQAQETNFTKQDTLRGSITPEREWWDLTFYHLDIKVTPEDKYIEGKNTVRYRVIKPYNLLQIDLQSPMQIDKVTQDDQELEVIHEGNAHFIKLKKTQTAGEENEVVVHYSGHPREAVRAPWDGGLSWKKDVNGNHFVATSCQGLGASVWWPCKDHMYDEVDSMKISVNVPADLMDVSNGRLVGTDDHGTTKTWHWQVDNPINNYGVNINIGDYVHFGEVYEGEKGPLDMNYYVVSYNLDKAKEQFKQAPMMMKAFEHWFGPYPFYEDGFKLVEVPYLGMEHQSSVTYGNQYGNGYLGRDLSSTGWGLKFDFIIIHESGHEWFANNITYKDIADMWIHESFTAYSEGLYVEYYYGKEAGADYLIGTRSGIRNNKPIIGNYDVNNEGSGDMYPKGANMLHTIRQLVEDDEKWRMMLRGLNKEFYHQTVTTKQIEDYISDYTGKDLTALFNQYLRDIRIPNLEYRIKGKQLEFRYTDIVEDFDMPVIVEVDGKSEWIFPENNWKSLAFKNDINKLKVNKNFYIRSTEMK